jgi:ppGpp synthetase/RelA/SpoT-type nucleotidyltranferase
MGLTFLSKNELAVKGNSDHYQVKLGEKSDAPYGFEDLQFEFQLRTIPEAAWGEIDHKFRYVGSRDGVSFLEYQGSEII